MRIKKDPGIRQEAFIKAATELFMEKGYEDVSIRDVLDGVADKSASPSVFYYYFDSKDAIYHACIKDVANSYVEGIRKEMAIKYKSFREWMLALIDYLREYLINEKNLVKTGGSAPNRKFVLDMRAKVTKQVGVIWMDSLISIDSFSQEDVRMTAQFLAGGIGEMIYNFLLGDDNGVENVETLIMNIARLSANTVGLSGDEKESLMSEVKARLKSAS